MAFQTAVLYINDNDILWLPLNLPHIPSCQIPPKLDKRGLEANLHGELHVLDEHSIHCL